MRKRTILFVTLLLALLSAGVLIAAQTKSDSDAAGVSIVVFGAKDRPQVVKSIYAKSATSTATLVFYTKTGSAAQIGIASTNAATTIFFTNTQVTNDDFVVYQHSGGAVFESLVTSATATSALLATALSTAGTTSDYVYEVTENGTIYIANTAFNQDGPVMYAIPANSPLYIVCTGIDTNYLLVTVD